MSVQDRPNARELLESVRLFLEKDVVPALDGPARFHARVAANVLAIVGRELESEEPDLVAEWTRLATLLGYPGDAPPDRLVALRAAVAKHVEGTVSDVILAATNTHSGPGGLSDVPFWRPCCGPQAARAARAPRPSTSPMSRQAGSTRSGSCRSRRGTWLRGWC